MVLSEIMRLENTVLRRAKGMPSAKVGECCCCSGHPNRPRPDADDERAGSSYGSQHVGGASGRSRWALQAATRLELSTPGPNQTAIDLARAEKKKIRNHGAVQNQLNETKNMELPANARRSRSSSGHVALQVRKPCGRIMADPKTLCKSDVPKNAFSGSRNTRGHIFWLAALRR